MFHQGRFSIESIKEEEQENLTKVQMGLAKCKKCALCDMNFFCKKLPGKISYNSILNLRKKWGLKVGKPKPSIVYSQRPICIFCCQFFEGTKVKKKKKKKKKKKYKLRILFNEEDFDEVLKKTRSYKAGRLEKENKFGKTIRSSRTHRKKKKDKSGEKSTRINTRKRSSVTIPSSNRKKTKSRIKITSKTFKKKKNNYL